MTTDTYTLEPAEALSPAALTTLGEICGQGFPPPRRASAGTVTVQCRDGEFALVLLGDGQPLGFAKLRPLDGTSWIYLHYFTVRRGHGIGGLLWERLAARLRAAGFTLLVLDVEEPSEPGQPEARFRRIGFFRRHGARLLPATGYTAPHAAPESSGWSPMLLMTAPLSPDGPPADSGPPAHSGRPAGSGRARAIAAAVYRLRWPSQPDGSPAIGQLTGDQTRWQWAWTESGQRGR
jgi:GNAT superfamily N-acetyltransferase